MKLLMVTCRKIDQKGGENALIMGRHIALYKAYGIETDIIFSNRNTAASTPYEGIKFLSCNGNKLYEELDRLLYTKQYQGIVVSGFYDRKFNTYIINKKREIPLLYIVDIHATIREVYEYHIPDLYHTVGVRYLYLVKRINFIDTMKKCDYAFVVSDEEVKEVNRYYPKNKIKFVKIRCGCYENINKAQYLKERKEHRDSFGFDIDTLAFVYSGSKDGWQKYDETVALFSQIGHMYKKSKFAFYMDLNQDEKEELYKKLGKDNVIVRWIDPEELKKELTAFDCGVLLRDNNWTNRVAFPNKFSDYICTGLDIILSRALVEPYKLIRKYHIGLFDEKDLKKSLSLLLDRRKHHLDEYIDTCISMIEKELLYTTQVQENAKVLFDDLRAIKIENEGSSNG